ncbi:MAG: hypothetical protein J5760_00495, partial [Clostridia bacterium]|nr:hypothetical protein [Clostridia bacterium]
MKKLVSLLLALALLCTVAFVGVYAEEEGEEENLLEIVGITFDSVAEGEVVEFVRGGAESNAVLIDGDYMEGPQATPNHQAKGIVLVQNTRCNEAGVYPEYTYTLELKDKDTFDRLKIGFYEYFMAMIGLPKDNSIGVEASEDGSDWTFVGDYEFEGEALKDEVAGNVYVIDLGKAVTAKYVRLTFAFGDSPFGTAEYGNSEKVIWEWHGFTEFGVIGADTVVIDDPEPGEPS